MEDGYETETDTQKAIMVIIVSKSSYYDFSVAEEVIRDTIAKTL